MKQAITQRLPVSPRGLIAKNAIYTTATRKNHAILHKRSPHALSALHRLRGPRRRVTCTSRRRPLSASCSKIRSRNKKKSRIYLYMRMRLCMGGDMPSRYPLRTWMALVGGHEPAAIGCPGLHRIDMPHILPSPTRAHLTHIGYGQGTCTCRMGPQGG